MVTDLKTKRVAGIKKDTFEGLLKAVDIPAKYYCRRSFATWDVLLPSEDFAAKLAGENVISKYFRVQPEYMGRRKIRITVCNVPIQLNEEVLAAYLTKHGEIEDITKAKSVNGTTHGDYIFTMCMDRGGFTAIPHIIEYEHQIMTVVVEGRKPQCWNCKQLGHFSKSCPQKTTKTTPATTTTTTETTMTSTSTITAAATAATTAEKNETPKAKTGDSPDKEEGWTQVVKGGKKKTPIKEPATKTDYTKSTITTTAKTDSIATNTISTAKTSSSSSLSSTKSTSSSSSTKKKNKEKTEKTETEAIDFSVNLKRRRDSGDSVAGEGEKKHIKGPTQETQTQSQIPSQPQQKGENIERPAQIIPPPQKPQNTPAHFSDFPLSPKSPSLSPVKTPRQLVRSHSLTRESPTKEAVTSSSPSSPSTHQKPRSNESRRAFTAYHYCQDILESQNMDHILKKTLKPLSSLKSINGKDITNPYLFKNAAMVTTFVRSAGPRTKELWHFLEGASRPDVMLADLRHQSFKKLLHFCSGRAPILVHPSFYRSLRLRYPVDVGGITRDDRVSTELGTGSLRQAVGILTPKDFRPVVDTE